MKRISVTTAAITALIAFVAVAGLYFEVFTVTHAQQTESADTKVQEPELPEHVPYMFAFRHLAKIQDNPSKVKELRGKSGLSRDQFQKVVQVALDYSEEVKGLDAEAQIYIDDFHAKYPPGKLPEGTGPPPPPQELIDLQARKNNAALTHRERLQSELGSKYGQFEEFVDAEVTSKIKNQRTKMHSQEAQ